MWKQERILSEEWVNIVIDNGYEFTSIGDGWYGKGGMRGQMLMFNMEKGLVVGYHSYESKVPYQLFISNE